MKLSYKFIGETDEIDNPEWGDVIDIFGVEAVLEYFISQAGEQNDDEIFFAFEALADEVEEI